MTGPGEQGLVFRLRFTRCNSKQQSHRHTKDKTMKLSAQLLLPLLASTSLAKRLFDLSELHAEFDSVKSKREALTGETDYQMPLFIPDGEEPQTGPTLLTSGINTNTNISLFAGYVRDDMTISELCNNKKKQTVVFAPTDTGIESLKLKPWQFPTPVDDEGTEEEIARTIASNVDDFVKSHMVDGSVPFDALEDQKKGALLETMNGKRLKLVNDEGEYYVSPGGETWIKVESVTTVDNGAILVISKPLVSV